MGSLSEFIKNTKRRRKVDPYLLSKIEEKGEKDAEKIAEKMGQTTRNEVSPRVNVSELPPIEMPIQEEQERTDGEGR